MNPLRWPNSYKIALLISVLIGVLIGALLGYQIYTNRFGFASKSLDYWVNHPIKYGVYWWGLLGGSIATGLMLIKRLTNSS